MKASIKRCLAGLAFLSFLGCSLESKMSRTDSEVEENSGPALSAISVDVAGEQTNLLASSPSDFKIEMVGCDSKLSSEATLSSPSLKVYVGDTNCIAELREIRIDDRDYIAPVGAKFTQGESLAYESTSGDGDRIFITVGRQLSNPIKDDDKVVFRFSELVEGDGASIQVGENDPSEVEGYKAPSIVLKKIYYKKYPDNDYEKNCKSKKRKAHNKACENEAGKNSKSVKFQFELACSESLDLDEPVSCGSQKVKDFKFSLIKDESNGQPLTQKIFEGIDDSNWLGFLDKGNGAFNKASRTYLTKVLPAPKGALNAEGSGKMIFVVKGSGGSYIYFRVSVSSK